MIKKNPLTTFTRSKSFPLIIILVVMTVITMIISHGNFLSSGNLLTLLYGMVIQVIMLCGIGCILISGNIDLSVGGQAALCTMVFAWLCKNTGLPWGIVLLITPRSVCPRSTADCARS